LRRHEWLGAGLIVVCILILLLTRLPYDADWFWADYVKALFGWGWVAMLVGVVWTALAVARGRTHFLTVEEPISPDSMTISVVAVLIVAAIACYTAVTLLPRTPRENLPLNGDKRAVILKTERGTRLFLGAFVLISGAGVAAFPVIRHLRNGKAPAKGRRQ
jgi:hypothetical protein